MSCGVEWELVDELWNGVGVSRWAVAEWSGVSRCAVGRTFVGGAQFYGRLTSLWFRCKEINSANEQ